MPITNNWSGWKASCFHQPSHTRSVRIVQNTSAGSLRRHWMETRALRRICSTWTFPNYVQVKCSQIILNINLHGLFCCTRLHKGDCSCKLLSDVSKQISDHSSHCFHAWFQGQRAREAELDGGEVSGHGFGFILMSSKVCHVTYNWLETASACMLNTVRFLRLVAGSPHACTRIWEDISLVLDHTRWCLQ